MYKLAVSMTLSIAGVFGTAQAEKAPIPLTSRDLFDDLERTATAKSDEQALEAKLRQHYFVESFNRLAVALEEFAKTYKVTHAVDAKKAKSVRDAYRKLEKADPWFRIE